LCLTLSPAVSTYHAFNCRRFHLLDAGSYLVLDADEGPFNRQGLCRVAHPHLVNGRTYTATVRLRTWRGTDNNANRGVVGMMYNVYDMDNFDFIVYR